MLKTMDNKIALLVIYNHRYDKNIPRINQVYANRFSYVYHIVPFYDGDLENVIPVYDNSFQFQGYISQAYQHLKGKGFTHFVCVADDMVINPQLNEHNFFELSGIDEDACFVHELRDLRDVHRRWFHIGNAIRLRPSNGIIFPHGLCRNGHTNPCEDAQKKCYYDIDVSYGIESFSESISPIR